MKTLQHPSIQKCPYLYDLWNQLSKSSFRLKLKSKNWQHLKIINNLLEPFKEKDCICDIRVTFDVEENYYDIYLVFSQAINQKIEMSIAVTGVYLAFFNVCLICPL